MVCTKCATRIANSIIYKCADCPNVSNFLVSSFLLSGSLCVFRFSHLVVSTCFSSLPLSTLLLLLLLLFWFSPLLFSSASAFFSLFFSPVLSSALHLSTPSLLRRLLFRIVSLLSSARFVLRMFREAESRTPSFTPLCNCRRVGSSSWPYQKSDFFFFKLYFSSTYFFRLCLIGYYSDTLLEDTSILIHENATCHYCKMVKR